MQLAYTFSLCYANDRRLPTDSPFLKLPYFTNFMLVWVVEYSVLKLSAQFHL